MRRFLFVVLAVVVVCGVGVAWLLADANRFKPQLTGLIQSRIGLSVDFRGDLAWRLWPPLQLVAQDVAADWTPPTDAPLLAARTLRLNVDVWPLLSRKPRLVIRGVVVDGLRANLVQHGAHANWMPPDSAGPVVPPLPVPLPADAASSGQTTDWQIDDIAVSEAVVDYRVDDDATQIRIDALHLSDVAPARPFPFRAKLTIERGERRFPLTIATQVTLEENIAHFDALDVGGDFGAPGNPFHLTANARVDSVARTLDAAGAQLDVASASGSFDLHATPDQVDLTNVELRTAATRYTGSISSPIAAKPNLRFDLVADRLIVPTRPASLAMLGGGSFAALAFAAPAVTVDTSPDQSLLPLELLRSVDWDGSLSIDQLIYEGATLRGAKLVSKGADAVTETTIDLPDCLGGSCFAHVAVDARSDVPQWTIAPKLHRIDTQALLAVLHERFDWVAKLIANGEFALRGNTRAALIASLAGNATFDAGTGMLDIRPIRSAALAVADLAGGSKQVEAWPERLNYQRFTGTWSANAREHAFDLALDNAIVKGAATFDAPAVRLDLRGTLTVTDDRAYQTFKLNSALTGLPLPFRCAGALDAPHCGADEDAARKLLADAISGKDPDARKRLDKTIDEKVPEKYRDAAKSLLDLLNKGASKPSP